MPSRCRCRKRPYLARRLEPTGFSRVVAGYSRVTTGSSRTRFRGFWKGDSLSELRIAPRDSSPVSAGSYVPVWSETGTSCFGSSAAMDLGVPLQSPQGSQAWSPVITCTSSFLPSCSSSVRVPVELTHGCLSFPRDATGLWNEPRWCEAIRG